MRRSRGQWAEIVEQFERSGQSHETFCTQHRLNVGSFRGWLYRSRGSSGQGKVARSATRLLPVRVASVAGPEVAAGDAMLRVRGSIGPAYVAELVTLLRGRC